MARSPLSGRELARRNGKGLCDNRRLAIPGLAGFRGSAQRPRTISTQSRKGRRARKDFWGRALAKPVRERPWLKSYLWRDQPRTITDALRLRLRKFPRGGATAPDQGNCRGRASRGRDEPDASLKRASCVVGPVARPSAVPRQIGKAASQHGKARKAVGESRKPEVDKGKKFPKVSHPPTGGFPIWCAEAKPPGGEGRRMKLASRRRLPGRSLATRGGAPASQIRRGSAQPRTVLRGLRGLRVR